MKFWVVSTYSMVVISVLTCVCNQMKPHVYTAYTVCCWSVECSGFKDIWHFKGFYDEKSVSTNVHSLRTVKHTGSQNAFPLTESASASLTLLFLFFELLEYKMHINFSQSISIEAFGQGIKTRISPGVHLFLSLHQPQNWMAFLMDSYLFTFKIYLFCVCMAVYTFPHYGTCIKIRGQM